MPTNELHDLSIAAAQYGRDSMIKIVLYFYFLAAATMAAILRGVSSTAGTAACGGIQAP
jgi:hypothetical protein